MRKTPIIALVEHVRKQMMKAITKRRQPCLKWPNHVPAFINKKMNNVLKISRNYHVILASDVLHEVETCQKSYIVNLDGIHITVGCGKSVAYLVSMQCLVQLTLGLFMRSMLLFIS